MSLNVGEFKPEIEVVGRLRDLVSLALAGVDVGQAYTDIVDEIAELDAPATERALIEMTAAKIFYDIALSRALEQSPTFGDVYIEAMHFMSQATERLQHVVGKLVMVPERRAH